MNKTFQKIVGGVLAVTALMGLSACGSKTEDNKAEGKTYKVGIVQFVDDASLNQIEAAIEAELDAKAAELGVTFDYTLYNGQADATTLNQIGAELVSKGVDLIVPIATPAVKIMQSATEDTEIPIVFSAVSDPVGAGIVDALDAPGGRITGTSDALNTKGLLDLMLAQNPDTKTVGLLYSKSEDSSKQPIEDAKAYLEGKGIRCVEKTGTTTDEVTSAVDALIAEKVDAVFTPTDNTIMTAELAIYEKFLNAKIPQYCGADSFALNGAFVGYGVDYTKLGTITADMVKVNLLAIGAVFLILLLMKRQLLLPIILVLSIETAIWINLAIPYFRGQYVFYIAYLIISSVQLGATVDYAILFSDRYQEFRETLGRKEAVAATVSAVTTSVSTTGSAMAVVGFLMGAISTNQLLGQLGNFLGVGSLVSLAIVLSALPGFLYLADPLIIKKKRQPKEA